MEALPLATGGKQNRNGELGRKEGVARSMNLHSSVGTACLGGSGPGRSTLSAPAGSALSSLLDSSSLPQLRHGGGVLLT